MGYTNKRDFMMKKNILAVGLLLVLATSAEAGVQVSKEQVMTSDNQPKIVLEKEVKTVPKLNDSPKVAKSAAKNDDNSSAFAYRSETIEQSQTFYLTGEPSKTEQPLARETTMLKRVETTVNNEGNKREEVTNKHKVTEKAYYLRDKSGKIQRVVESRSEEN